MLRQLFYKRKEMDLISTASAVASSSVVARVEILPVLAFFISIISLIISAVTLYKSILSKFRAVYSVGDLNLRIYPIKNGKRKWFIPSIDIPISFANSGANSGIIQEVRVVATYPNLPINDHWDIFLPKWEISSSEFNKSDKKDRFNLIDNAVISDWMSFIVLPKKVLSKHLVFETTWEKPVIQEKVLFTLQIKSETSAKWEEVEQWELPLNELVWSELTQKGTSIGTKCKTKFVDYSELVKPEDLHKYTGTNAPIPKGGFQAKDSFMDYSEDE